MQPVRLNWLSESFNPVPRLRHTPLFLVALAPAFLAGSSPNRRYCTNSSNNPVAVRHFGALGSGSLRNNNAG